MALERIPGNKVTRSEVTHTIPAGETRVFRVTAAGGNPVVFRVVAAHTGPTVASIVGEPGTIIDLEEQT